ncbi:PhnD/SsuA/transferrin family substrate-binding protein [Rhabdochromatium marinum]|uniref:PhnD/SsuA/transferrin family substrate-binding protein n=1 Tax=Rhabdochromatium marinum TaxID=48729 RepID=UPI0019068171|nr:PhnD/SsuA/transferrin family substrate-binding protein [Rhabdochromatium marinum]MBK1649293.1 hypothetical protein [Rhabdochromatium marinum]
MKIQLLSRIPCWLGVLLLGVLCALGFGQTSADSETPLRFGVVPQQSASRLAALWVPLLTELEQRGAPALVFRTAPDIPTFERRLAASEYDLAFPSPAAFAASILTRANLASAGVHFRPHYVSSHDSVYRGVAKGLYPAGGGVVRTFESVAPDIRKQLRIFWTSDGYTPHAFAAHPRLLEETVSAIATAMLGLSEDETGRALLEPLHLPGLEAAQNAEWDDVRALDIQLLDELIEQVP